MLSVVFISPPLPTQPAFLQSALFSVFWPIVFFLINIFHGIYCELSSWRTRLH